MTWVREEDCGGGREEDGERNHRQRRQAAPALGGTPYPSLGTRLLPRIRPKHKKGRFALISQPFRQIPAVAFCIHRGG